MKNGPLSQPLVPGAKGAKTEHCRLKRKKHVHNGEITFTTTYYIEGEKFMYNSEETLERTQKWVDAVSKGASDIRHYSEQLKALVEKQASEYLSGQAAVVIGKYYDYGTNLKIQAKPIDGDERSHEIQTEEQKQLQVAIHQVEECVGSSIKDLKNTVQLLRQKVFLLQKLIKIEQLSPAKDIKEDEQGLAEENISSISTDLRMINNQYRYALKKFSDATNDFFAVQLGRENRFKDLIFQELVQQRNVKEKKTPESARDRSKRSPSESERKDSDDEHTELHKLASQIMNFASYQSASCVETPQKSDESTFEDQEDEKQVAVQQELQTVQSFPSYRSSASVREYVVESYHQKHAEHKLEEMIELSNEILSVERSLLDLQELLSDLATLIRDQTELMNDIFINMQSANQYVERSIRTIRQTKRISQESRQKIVIISVVFLILAGVALVILNKVM